MSRVTANSGRVSATKVHQWWFSSPPRWVRGSPDQKVTCTGRHRRGGPAAGRAGWPYAAPPVELAAFQQLMDELYGDADRERGVPVTVAWLCEELGELA